MAKRQVTLLRKIGTDIQGPGQLDRNSVLSAFASGNKERITATLKRVAASGQQAAAFNLVEPVGRLLAHQDDDVCKAALDAWGNMGEVGVRFADDVGEHVLKHPSAPCRAAALEALGKMGLALSRASRQQVISRLVDDEPSVRQAAVRALIALGATASAKAVQGVLGDASPGVRGAAIEALGYFVAASEEVESSFGLETLRKPLLDLLKNGSTRCSALIAVQYLADKAPSECVDIVVDALGDKDGPTREAAAAAVGAMRAAVSQSSGAMRAVEAHLRSSETAVRAAAAVGVGAMGTEAASLAGAVAELLTDESEDTSALAAQVGATARRAPAVLRLPRAAAAAALGRLGDSSYVDNITSRLADASWEVRLVACEALGSFGPAATGEADSILGMLDDDAYPVRAAVCAALGEIGNPQACEGLIERFKDKAHTVRLSAVVAVGKLGADASEYTHDVFKMLDDRAAPVQAAAAISLSKLGENGLNYAGVLANMAYEAEPEVRIGALTALGGMGRHGAALAAEIAERAQGDPHPAVRRTAEAALAALGSSAVSAPGAPRALEDEGHYGYAGPAEALAQDRPRFEGMGLYYAEIQEKKKELQSSGQWIEGIF